MNEKLEELSRRPNMVILLIVVCFPLGLFLLWRSSAFSLKTKRLSTGVILVLVILTSMTKSEREVRSVNDDRGDEKPTHAAEQSGKLATEKSRKNRLNGDRWGEVLAKAGPLNAIRFGMSPSEVEFVVGPPSE